MALVIGHSQTKYLQEYLDCGKYSVFSYPGYRSRQLMEEEILVEVAPFFSVIVIVVGANDIGRKSPGRISDDLIALCRELHAESPSSTVLVSTVLPRCQNGFEGCSHSTSYLHNWNEDACEVNRRLRENAYQLDWIRVIEHPQFYTLFGVNKKLLSRDGLHLSFEGTHTLADNIDPDLSIIKEENELSQIDISSRDNSLNFENYSEKLWNAYLGLTNADVECLKQNGKINSNHMEAVHKLLKNRFSAYINGFQLTEKVPVFCKNEKRWKTKIPMDAVESPACQIHHNHNDHWVCSIFHNDSIYLLDSLGFDRPMDKIVPNGLRIQLSWIYGRNSKSFKVNIPSVMKQNNSTDCGLYAIAFVTSYCFRKSLCFDLIFDSGKLRSHLLQCFENQEISEFPLTNKTMSHRKSCDKKELKIENFCVCNLPECVDSVMVQCDKCCVWYHRSCINAPMDISTTDQDFICGLCSLLVNAI